MLIGVCEADDGTRTVITEALRRAGHETITARDGREALRRFGTDSGIDAMVIGFALPDTDARHVRRGLRSAGQTAPAVLLTALLVGEVPDLVTRLESFGHRGRPSLSPTPGLELNPARHSARTPSGEALLTPTEFRMLAAITSGPDVVVRRRSVVAAAWPAGTAVSENPVDSFMRRIRTKLASIDSPIAIETVRGVGFRVR
jgi:two-component system OmpR family response regulator